MKNKIILSFIIFSLLTSYIFPIISFGTYNNYISLGDSIPEGYGLEYPAGDNYAEKLRQKLNIPLDNFENLSVSAETTQRFYNTIQTDKYTKAIKNTDLITITIGSNEMVELVAEAVSYATGVPMTNDPTFPGLATNAFLDADLLKKLEMLLALYEYVTTEDIKGKVETNIKRYEEYWEKSIEYIKQINPNVTIVVTEFYNPYYEITLLNYDLSGWCDEIIQKLNTILYNYSKSETEYKIAKIYSTFNTTNPRLTNVNLSLTNFNLDAHPTALGHEIISLKILETLSMNSGSQIKTDISTLAITDINDQEYTGSSIEPSIVIKDGNSTLVEDKDYAIIYCNNINVGQASAVIIGIGNYTGKTTKTFNIRNSAVKDISTCTINSLDYQLYLGMNLEPDVVILDGTKVLQKNEDYTLTYQNNLNVGMATVIITGVGNYTGTVKTNFIIAPMTISTAVVQDIPDQLYTGKEIAPELFISFGAIRLLENTDYSVEYDNNIDIGTATVTITGKGNYTGTVAKEFNIVDSIDSQLQNISTATISKISDKTYTGSSITPDIIISINGETLKQNVDYKVFYSNNINVGTGIATVVGIGDYTGTVETTFKIAKKSIENLSLSDISAQEYTGEAIKPQVVLADNSTKLKENTDYTVTYYNNIDIGVATVQIYGKGNYTGTIFKTFNIIEPAPKPPVEDEPIDDNKNNDIDNTTINTTIPHAGTHLIFFISFIFLITLSIIFYKLSKRW